MKSERRFVAPMNAIEASQRAQYVLAKWKYRAWSIKGGIRFERSMPLAGLVAVHPHHVHARIDALLYEQPDGACSVQVTQEVFKYGQPCSNLDKMVWQGDLDDLERALTERREPAIDRNRENSYAGMISFKFIFVAILVPLIAFAWLLFNDNKLGAILMLVVIVLSAVILPHLPFRMPHFPLENRLPEFDSNYPRGNPQG